MDLSLAAADTPLTSLNDLSAGDLCAESYSVTPSREEEEYDTFVLHCVHALVGRYFYVYHRSLNPENPVWAKRGGMNRLMAGESEENDLTMFSL